MSCNIHDEAFFAWWVPYILAKCKLIISAVNRCYQKHAHKYGIEVLKSFEDCICINQENGNILGQDAI
jgi:hypothetical protein